ncbi:MAG: hotdog fold thioesterase [Sphingomonadaceae bacterium]|nr:hotdog fold thioesterase [Sphingomonadaceae bacterium]
MIWFGGKKPAFTGVGRDAPAGLLTLLGMEVVEIGDDFLRMRMPVDERTHQPMGRLHGGASVALAETAGSMAGSSCVDRDRFVAVGAEINANHVRPVFSGWVYATARPESLGNTLQVWSIRVEDEAGKLVCICRFTAAVIEYQRP